jgi:predicted hydrolase (HD superfamily)
MRLLIQLPGYADPAVPYMFHCHLLQHEDNGMLGQFIVVQPGQSPTGSSHQQHHDCRQAGAEEPVVNAVLAHAHERYRHSLMDKAVVHTDAVAGLLVAAALVRPQRSAGMKVSSVKKKLKEKAFEPGVNREEIYGAEATLGIGLDEFIAVAIAGIQ